MATVFGTDAQVLSTWPAGIRYNPNEDKYTFSVANNWKISPQDHLHVVDIDGPADLGPYELTLQLPILNQLPFSSRMYFFYVSNSQNLDVLTFIPTPLSGDTVNGSPFFHSFTMDGAKKLFIALAVNGNYIIHEFGGASGSATGGANPLNLFRALPFPTPQSLTQLGFPFLYPSTRAYTSYLWNTIPDADDYVTGMDGFIVPNPLVDFYNCPGFDITQSGIYRVTYCANGLQITVPHNANPDEMSPQGVIFTQTPGSLGAVQEHIESPASGNRNYDPPLNGIIQFISGVAGTGVTSAGGVNEPANSIDRYFGNVQWPPTEGSVVNGANGYILSNAIIPTVTPRGFQCTFTGTYQVSFNARTSQTFNLVSTTRSIGFYDAKMTEYLSDGSGATYVAYMPAHVPRVTPLAGPYILYGEANSTFSLQLTAGRYYTFHFNFDLGTDTLNATFELQGNVSFKYLSIGAGKATTPLENTSTVSRTMALNAGDQLVCALETRQSTYYPYTATGPDNSSVSFEYLGPLPTAPLALRSLALESPMHSQLPTSQVVQLQKQSIADKASAASSLASQQARQLQNSALNMSSASSSMPSFTLADIEKIVGQALAKQSSDSAASAASAAASSKRKRVSIGGVSSSSSADPAKSRKLSRVEEKEEEIL